jgi:hypothetical protein
MPYECPVCGYKALPEPPSNFSICPSCGTEFGYDDASTSHAALRRNWITHGFPWFSRSRPSPPNWNAWKQLIDAGYGYELPVVQVSRNSRQPEGVKQIDRVTEEVGIRA